MKARWVGSRWLVAGFVLLVVGLMIARGGFFAKGRRGVNPPTTNGLSKIEPSLAQAMSTKLASGPAGAHEMVRVAIVLHGSMSSNDRIALESAGATVEIVAPWGVEASVPYGRLIAISNLGFVEIIHLPLRPTKRS